MVFNPPVAHETGGRRAALDGLRALAVLAVLAYHFGGGFLVRGGFLGSTCSSSCPAT